ncbi:MAG: dipeptidase [Rhodospirillaceae bacterium]|jgi:membrane dipeptidase|nr:dipeptidase [Rhodospirillaceae bacterium]
MHRIAWLTVFTLAFPGCATAETSEDMIARARGIHDRVISVDTHVDIPPNFATRAYDPMKPGPRGQQVHIPTMIEGGLDATFIIVFVGQGPRTESGYAKALSDAFVKFAAIHRVTKDMYPDQIELALTADDVRRIDASGKKVALIGMENGYPMGKDLRLLDQFYDYGARYFGLIHTGHNDLGDSSVPNRRTNEPDEEHGGLTDLGRQVVHRLNELGIMVDVSHSSKQTALDMIAESKAPVIASHSSLKGVYDHPRNMSDEELMGIRDANGVVQVVAFDSYLRAVPQGKQDAIAELWKSMGIESFGDFRRLGEEALKIYDTEMAEIELEFPKAGIKDLVDHIDYAVRKVGINHVGIASDFNGGGGIAGWSDASETFNVTLELVHRGYTEGQISKLWGDNLLRVLADIEAYAQQFKG